MNKLAAYLIRFAKGEINYISSANSYDNGRREGWRRVIEVCNLSPGSMTNEQLNARLNWAIAAYSLNSPNEYERGIIATYRKAIDEAGRIGAK